jgi:DNA polymerase III subunit beta
MKIVVNSKELLKKVQNVSGIIGNNPLIPILETILVESDGEVTYITASDLATTVVDKINVKAEKGSFCIPSKILLDVLKNMPEQPIELHINEIFECTLKASKLNYKIAGENPKDFPKPKTIDGKEFSLKSDILLNAINTVSFACSTDDLRPAMTGMLIKGDGSNINFVGIDGFKMVEVCNDIDGIEISAIVGKKQLNILKSILPNGIDLSIIISDKNISFNFCDIIVIGRLIDEKFPDYKHVIPKNDKNLELNRIELLQSLKRLSLFSNKTTHMVKFLLTKNSLVISSQDLNYNNSGHETIDINFSCNFEIGLNAKQLLEILPNVKGDIINMSFSEPNRAVLISGSVNGELFLTMPVMLVV